MADMARFGVHQLDDALAEVGLHHLYAMLLEEGVHLALLGEHRLAFHHLLYVMLLKDVENNLVELARILRPMHDDTIAGGIVGKHLEIFVHVGDGVALDEVGLFAELLPFFHSHRHIVSLGSHRPEGGVVPFRLVGILEECLGGFAM